MASDGPTRYKATERGKRAGRQFSFETRIRIYCLVLAVPTIALVIVLLWRASFSVQATVVCAVILGLLLLSSLLMEEVVRPLQTLANVVASLREEDYSFRARGSHREDALGELSTEINALADMLQSQRLGELEATALLRRVIAAMDAPVLAFDQGRRLRLLNPAAERVLVLDSERDSGRRAEQLELAHVLDAPDEGVIMLDTTSAMPQSAPRKPGRWMVRRSSFRQRGVPHTLLLLSDVSSALREEERMAWRRLIRVLGHEISNSLAPIKSIAGSLRSRLPQSNAETGAESNGYLPDFDRGLGVIESRAESLNRFVQAYRQLAQLPAPAMRRVPVGPMLERVASLETRLEIALAAAPQVDVFVDVDQVEQLLINLVRNGVEAACSAREDAIAAGLPHEEPAVTMHSELQGDFLSVVIEDNGPGLTNPANLFVPFYTTKKSGSGVGLVLARQIAEAHGGTLELRNRAG